MIRDKIISDTEKILQVKRFGDEMYREIYSHICKLTQESIFLVQSDVMQFISETEDKLIKNIESARLPYQQIWVELNPTDLPFLFQDPSGEEWPVFPQYHQNKFAVLLIQKQQDMIDCCFFDTSIGTVCVYAPCTISMGDNISVSLKQDDVWPISEVGYDSVVWYKRVSEIIVSIIILLNTRNLYVNRASKPLDKLNRKRVKRGKRPLSEHRVLTLLPHVSCHKDSANPNGAIKHKSRVHWRRGHFKKRKTGIFWWNPHLAGDKLSGFVEKSYKLAGDAND